MKLTKSDHCLAQYLSKCVHLNLPCKLLYFIDIDKSYLPQQELKYAEISQRTKDTPPGLQYENTAPVEYFQHMVVAFDQQMVTYRQQIEQMETYLSSLHHNAILTPHGMYIVDRTDGDLPIFVTS